MIRQSLVLVGMAAVLAVVAFWFLVYEPNTEELAQVRNQIATTEAQQEQTRERILELEAVRDDAPALRAQLATAESIIPRETALPEMLDALEDAADDAGVVLVSVAPGRPTAAVEEADADADAGAEAPTELSRMGLSVQIDGAYEDIVDFLRLVEDPEITPRAVQWVSISLTEGADGYPELAASLSGDLFALVPPGGTEPVEPADTATEPPGTPTDEPTPGITPSPTPDPEEGAA